MVKKPKAMKSLLITLIAFFGIIFAGASVEPTNTPTDDPNSSYVEEQYGDAGSQENSGKTDGSTSSEQGDPNNSDSATGQDETTAPDSSDTTCSRPGGAGPAWAIPGWAEQGPAAACALS